MVEGMRFQKSLPDPRLQNHFEPDDSRFLHYHNRSDHPILGRSITIVILDYPILGSLITETSRITTSNRDLSRLYHTNLHRYYFQVNYSNHCSV
ncbi:hypothetical protein TNCT_540301 [Trichonephila clavata]|uniref:Uncharacterized protein n=1 Tax=Trichonephila clavata TaxID=2740835 RepID=A0A8X6H0T5_TRICU|nr:hypothetical protein TNCT_540301 [Trichonephila clavata]